MDFVKKRKKERSRHGWNHGSCVEEDERENGYKRNSDRVREAHNECF
jgi:hypothetical protein